MKKSEVGNLVFNSTDLHGKVQNDKTGGQNLQTETFALCFYNIF